MFPKILKNFVLIMLTAALLLTACQTPTAPPPVEKPVIVKEVQEKIVTQEVEVVKEVMVTPTAAPESTAAPKPTGIRLGYQAGLVSLESPNRRLWLSVEHHPGDTVSCTQAEALVLAAEKRSGQRPRRRTELLHERIEAFVQSRAPAEKRFVSQRAALAAPQSAQQDTLAQLRGRDEPQAPPGSGTPLCAPPEGFGSCQPKAEQDPGLVERTPGAGKSPTQAAGTV